jgi:ketol-acid reductoisomerase
MMRLTIIGLGNQAKAWAQNLTDSEFPVNIALRAASPSFSLAKEYKLSTVTIGTHEFYAGEAFALLTPDHTHEQFLEEHGAQLREGSVILYAHGYSLLKNEFQLKYPHLRHVLLAPKSIGTELRNQYLLKGKLGAVYSFEHVSGGTEDLKKWLLTLSSSLGINMGPYRTSFERETQADLYSEQGLLCSLIPYVARVMFNHLVDGGCEKELAYFECWHELKLIVAAMVDKGPEGFYDLISPNALIGSEKGFEKLMTPDLEARLKGLLTDIKSKRFDEEIDRADVAVLRKNIRDRWQNDPLNLTFKEINEKA